MNLSQLAGCECISTADSNRKFFQLSRNGFPKWNTWKNFSFEFQWVNSRMDGLRCVALNLMVESRIYKRTAQEGGRWKGLKNRGGRSEAPLWNDEGYQWEPDSSSSQEWRWLNPHHLHPTPLSFRCADSKYFHLFETTITNIVCKRTTKM